MLFVHYIVGADKDQEHVRYILPTQSFVQYAAGAHAAVIPKYIVLVPVYVK